uniref:Uncharacterized protein n=1 Tax=Arundo donax TaxID=35708 RepID=A0A0A9EVK8_ARUDO
MRQPSLLLRPLQPNAPTNHHPSLSPPPYLLHASAPSLPRSTPAPLVHVPRPRRRAVMAAAAASSLGVSQDAGVNSPATESVGQNDLLIVGPGVLGRIVADKWKQVATKLYYNLPCLPVCLYKHYLSTLSRTHLGHCIALGIYNFPAHD